MNDLIHDELAQVLADWKEGRRISTVALGHPVRVVDGEERPHNFRQVAAHDYCFWLIQAGLEAKEPLTWDMFAILITLAPPADLSLEERQAAESLAWKALRRGWQRALAGFDEEFYLGVRRGLQQ